VLLTAVASSLIRSPDYWLGYAAWMFGLYLDSYQAHLLTVNDSAANDPIRGYALVNFYAMGFVERYNYPGGFAHAWRAPDTSAKCNICLNRKISIRAPSWMR
jgi:hypothetical protein